MIMGVWLTYLEDPGVGIAVYHLLHRTSQEGIISLEAKTFLVEVVEHVVRKHMLQDRRLSSHGSRDILTNCRDKLDIDVVREPSYHISKRLGVAQV